MFISAAELAFFDTGLYVFEPALSDHHRNCSRSIQWQISRLKVPYI